jgi:predicted Zn-ribbon and HTH transcriptional regulator
MMNAKTAIEFLRNLRYDYIASHDNKGKDVFIPVKEIADILDQQGKQINAMRNCENCNYQEYTDVELPCNDCIRCFEGTEEDCWELRTELLKVDNNHE